MKTNKKDNTKKEYEAPYLFTVKLDNEISLSLESEPLYGPDELILMPKYNNWVDPFRLIF